jgi:hypothetical protein
MEALPKEEGKEGGVEEGREDGGEESLPVHSWSPGNAAHFKVREGGGRERGKAGRREGGREGKCE